jgi:hypothetical protein
LVANASEKKEDDPMKGLIFISNAEITSQKIYSYPPLISILGLVDGIGITEYAYNRKRKDGDYSEYKAVMSHTFI